MPAIRWGYLSEKRIDHRLPEEDDLSKVAAIVPRAMAALSAYEGHVSAARRLRLCLHVLNLQLGT